MIFKSLFKSCIRSCKRSSTRATSTIALVAFTLAGPAIFGSATFSSEAHAAKDKAPLTEAQLDIIHKAEKSFNDIQSMTARFAQSTSMGDYAEGKVYLSKPGRLRIEYDPPIPVLVVADGSYFTFIDKELDQQSYIDLDSTPAGVLLRKSINLTEQDIRVVDVAEHPGVVNITVTSKSDPTVGKLSLIFTTKPFMFRQWQVTDAQGITTSVTLQNMETGVELDRKLFISPDP